MRRSDRVRPHLPTPDERARRRVEILGKRKLQQVLKDGYGMKLTEVPRYHPRDRHKRHGVYVGPRCRNNHHIYSEGTVRYYRNHNCVFCRLGAGPFRYSRTPQEQERRS